MLSRISIKKPFTVLVAVILIIVFGVVSYMKMTPDLFPKIDLPYVIVMTSYQGSTPEESEAEVTAPMEQQMATLADLKNIQSVSGEGYSMIMLEFNSDADLDTVSVDIRDKIDIVSGRWNENVTKPTIMKLNPDMMPVTVAAVNMKGKTSARISDLLNEELLRQLEGTDGVASVSGSGMVENSIHVELDQDKIDKTNKKVRDAVLSRYAQASGQLEDGISSAGSQQEKIDDSKKGITEAQIQLAKQTEASRILLQRNKNQLEDQLTLDPTLAPYIVPRISAIEEAISNLNIQSQIGASRLSNAMSETVSAGAMLSMTVDQLQSSLNEINAQGVSALSSADLTGILTMGNISSILEAQNFAMPAGYITENGTDMMVSLGDKFKSINEIEELVLLDTGIPGTGPVTVADVAKVRDFSDSENVYAKINGEAGVLLTFSKQSDYPTTETAGNIQDKFKELEKKYDGLEFTTLSDQGEYIYMAIASVLQNLFLGAVLAILILMFFLRDIRPTLITALSIPISVTFAIALMYFTGITLNVISLAGLAVGVGMLVDNSIIVIENIYRLRSLGYSNIQAALSGVTQMSGAITASTLTTVCVFIPIVFVEGITREIFVDMALTVTYSLMASLLVALTLVPVMGRGFLKDASAKTVLSRNSRYILKYRKAVRYVLSHKSMVMIIAALLLVASSALAFSRGFEYMPPMSTPEISVDIELPKENTLKETAGTCDKIAEQIKDTKGVETVGVMLSSNTAAMFGFTADLKDYSRVSMYVLLDEDKTELNPSISKKIKETGEKYGCEMIVSGDVDMSSYSAMGGSGIVANIYADDLDDLRKFSSRVEKKLGTIKGTENISDSEEDAVPEVKITVNKNKAMEKGFTTAQIYAQVSAALTTEQNATSMTYDGNRRDIVVTTSENSKTDLDKLKNLELVASNQGTGEAETAGGSGTKKVKLSEIADISNDRALETIVHDKQKRTIQVTSEVEKGQNVTKITEKARDSVEKMNIPSGTEVEFTGENETIMDAMKQLVQMLLLGLLMIYLVMVAQFQSLRAPFIVMFTVPLAFTGGLLGLLITGNDVSVVSMIGFIMLMGVIVNNAIVLIDTVNRLRKEGMDKREAIEEAGSIRLRPVLMTALTTALALMPMAFGFGEGAEMMQPVAIVCIGGLVYATFMTLLVIPVMYDVLSRKKTAVISEEELTIIDE